MARIFVIDDREHPDPDPSRTIEEVRDMFADFFPDLANATHTVTQRGEDQVIDFMRTVGTKGEQHRNPDPRGSIPPPPANCRCGGAIVVARTPDEAFCDDCGRRYAYDFRYGWMTP